MKSFWIDYFNCMEDTCAKVYGTAQKAQTFIHLSQLLKDRPVIQSDVNQIHRFPQQEKELDKSVG
jgi:hypothetical protein